MSVSPSLKSLQQNAAAADTWIQSVEPATYPEILETLFPVAGMVAAQKEISQWPEYKPTALISLTTLATAAGVGQVLYKDESTRLGLGSFKALGGAYAVLHYLSKRLSADTGKNIKMSDIRAGIYREQTSALTVATATDGNHGRSVAWGARQAGCQCRIYIHREVSQGREQAMSALGADVVRIDGDYDESVQRCASDSEQHNWQVISDTSYEGYRDIPRQVMAGYTTMIREILDESGKPPTHVFVQAGVGGLAGAVAAALWAELGDAMPKLVVVESSHADCIIRSMRANAVANVKVEHETIMAGLSCGEMSEVAYDILSRCTTAVMTLPDDEVAHAMKIMAAGQAADQTLEAGECAVPGIIALLAACKDSALTEHLGLSGESRVLVFGCEGATDPVLYQQLLAH
ncbi:MAG: diaminopropionate ammonia-lyase [Gammaproteobacteria bacterium]|nr:diaminopropionate ammonia-lyase [Gammaproteobacteria bacterium]